MALSTKIHSGRETMARGTICRRAKSSSLATNSAPRIPGKFLLVHHQAGALGEDTWGRGWVKSTQTSNSWHSCCHPRRKKGRRSCVWKNTRRGRRCQKIRLVPAVRLICSGICWIGTIGGLGFPWATQGVFLPHMEAQLVEILLYMAEK